MFVYKRTTIIDSIRQKMSYTLVAYNWLCLINIEINFTKLTQGFYAASNDQSQNVTFCTVFSLLFSYYFLGEKEERRKDNNNVV